MHDADHSVLNIRVLAPGTTSTERRILALTDLAPAIGAFTGLVTAAVIGSTGPFVIAALLLGGTLAATVLSRAAGRRVRRSIRSLTVTTYQDDLVAGSDEALFESCLRLVASLDRAGSCEPVEYERLWGALYFSLPPRP